MQNMLISCLTDLQHAVFLQLLGGKLGLAPITNPHAVLDIGTGMSRTRQHRYLRNANANQGPEYGR